MLENFLAYKPLNALSARKVSEACSYKWKILKSLEAKNGSTKPGITTSITFPEWRVKILLDAFKSFTVSVYGLIDATFFHSFTFFFIFLFKIIVVYFLKNLCFEQIIIPRWIIPWILFISFHQRKFNFLSFSFVLKYRLISARIIMISWSYFHVIVWQ